MRLYASLLAWFASIVIGTALLIAYIDSPLF